MTSKIIDWSNVSVGTLAKSNIQPNSFIFHGSDSTWVMRITADRKIEVNNDIEVSVLAQQVLDALQILLKPKEWQGVSDDEINDLEYYTYNNIAYARAIEAKLKEKNNG